MKRIFGLMALTLAVGLIGCQKAPDSTRIGASDVRTQGLPPGSTTTPTGITLNGLVTADPSYQSAFEQAVKDFMEAVIDPDYVGTVSSQGANQTGVLVGGKVEFTNGQPLRLGQLTGRYDVLPSSELLVAVYDKFQDQPSLAPLPLTYLRQAQGYVQGSQVYLDFYDKYGHVYLEGQIQGSTTVLKFSYDTQLTFDGQRGYRGVMGDLHIPTCQFFRCQ